MIKPEEILAKITQDAERIMLQAEQEKAMAEVLPIRFEQNMVAFYKYIPSIHKAFLNYKVQREFRFFCTENGIPNLAWIDENVAIYGDDPYSQCQQQIKHMMSSSASGGIRFGTEKNFFNQIHIDYLNQLAELLAKKRNEFSPLQQVPESMPFMMMFGVGLGYQLGYLYETCKVANLFVFEPDLDLFYASLYAFDWASLLDYIMAENLRIHIFLGQDQDNLMNDALHAIHKAGPFIAAAPVGLVHYPSEIIEHLVAKMKKEFFLFTMGWGFFDDNMLALSHSVENISKGIPFLVKGKSLPDKYNTVPVFIIGNGPSLDATIPYIKENKNKAILISCGSSISALHKEGIKPDIYVTIERTKAVPDFIALINDEDYLKDILYISTDLTHPDCHQFFRRSLLAFKPNEPMLSLASINFEEVQGFDYFSHVNPLVGNTGISVAARLGFKEIYLFGIDNGHYDSEHHHSRLSSYYDDNGAPIAALQRLATAGSDQVIPGNFGGEVISSKMFVTSIRVMERLIREYSGTNFFNTSHGAKIEGAEALDIKESQFGDLPVSFNKIDIIEFIANEVFKPLNIDRSRVASALDVDYFNFFIDKVLLEWKEPLLSRADIVNRMMRQFEYLLVIENSRQCHISRVLIGTFNYLFSFLITFCHAFADEEETLDAVSDALEIFNAYLSKAKELYPQALDSPDKVDCEIISLYRSN
ncbi:motility associated factor glycosyltransferase family protein [Aeromonas caviae]|uniref:motility associated factor glycosyltransferase family protein n=1 Tax=Aeromonas caviae TaxID=648 RepID=UPI0039F449BC